MMPGQPAHRKYLLRWRVSCYLHYITYGYSRRSSHVTPVRPADFGGRRSVVETRFSPVATPASVLFLVHFASFDTDFHPCLTFNRYPLVSYNLRKFSLIFSTTFRAFRLSDRLAILLPGFPPLSAASMV